MGLHSLHLVCMGLGLGVCGVKKSTCGVALNKEQFDPTSSSTKNVRVSIRVQNTTVYQSAGGDIKSHSVTALVFSLKSTALEKENKPVGKQHLLITRAKKKVSVLQ